MCEVFYGRPCLFTAETFYATGPGISGKCLIIIKFQREIPWLNETTLVSSAFVTSLLPSEKYRIVNRPRAVGCLYGVYFAVIAGINDLIIQDNMTSKLNLFFSFWRLLCGHCGHK